MIVPNWRVGQGAVAEAFISTQPAPRQAAMGRWLLGNGAVSAAPAASASANFTRQILFRGCGWCGACGAKTKSGVDLRSAAYRQAQPERG